MRNISNFERGLYLATEKYLDDFDSVTIRDGYSTVTYTREDLETIGEIVVEEQYMDWLMSQGQEAYEAEIEREQREREEYERWLEEQFEGVKSDDAA